MRKTEDVLKRAAPDQRKAKRLAVSFILVPVLLTLLWGVGEYLATERPEGVLGPSPEIGGAAPLFDYPVLGGGRISLAEQRNKVVLINVWATWCAPCLQEMPDLQRLYERLKKMARRLRYLR